MKKKIRNNTRTKISFKDFFNIGKEVNSIQPKSHCYKNISQRINVVEKITSSIRKESYKK